MDSSIYEETSKGAFKLNSCLMMILSEKSTKFFGKLKSLAEIFAALARFPIRRIRLIDEKARQTILSEHFLFGKPDPLFREMLLACEEVGA
jgi:hypothetical protein